MCSGEGCAEVFEALGPLEELEALACECGCALEVIGWPDPVELEPSGAQLEPAGTG